MLGAEVLTIARFPTGNCHYVYDVVTDDGRRVAVRLAGSDTRDILAGGIYWHERLRAAGVPVPALLYAERDPDDGFPVMILERLPGRDLAIEYSNLTAEQKRALAGDIGAIQRRVASLAPASGYGFARTYGDPDLHTTWLDVILADLERSRRRIASAGLVVSQHVERVRLCVDAIEPYLLAIRPDPFLDDLTTKNVLIYNGALSGIVDTDHVCFGDALFTVALTRMALLARRHETDYIDYWCQHLRLDREQQRALAAYTAVFCVNFLSEVGQRFNKDAPEPPDTAYLRHLESVLQSLLAEC